MKTLHKMFVDNNALTNMTGSLM